jgi:hypothetical protein
MDEPHDEHTKATPLGERLWDLLVFVPAGIATSVVEDFPAMAERGRQKLGLRVSSARAVGQFAVQAGQDQLRRRSGGRRTTVTGPVSGGPAPDGPAGDPGAGSDTGSPPTRPAPAVRAGGNIPAVSTLSIPGFDTLSASQVVQRLDGLNRSELVSVRAYESSTRGRRTILSRVDQLLDERS